jgi:hypothetical protein
VHRLLVELLHKLGRLLRARARDLRHDLAGLLVAGVDAVEVEDPEAAELAHGDGEGGVHDAVHGRGQEGDLELDAAEGEARVRLFGVDRHIARHQGDLVESVCSAGLPVTADEERHRYPP